MELQQLKYFVEICKVRSFARAAENCFISPQGISMAIQRLESELQCRLFVRKRSTIYLTKHAKFLLPISEIIMDNVDACEKYFSIGKNLSQRVKLVLARGAFAQFAEAPIQEFKDTYPHIYLDLRNDNDVGAETAVLCKESELALCSGPINNELLDAKFLCSSRFAAYVHKDHPLAQQDSVSVVDLSRFPLAIMQEHTKTYPLLLAAAKAAGVELRIEYRADNMMILFDAAEFSGQVGISTMALTGVAAKTKRNLKAIPLREQSLKWSLHIIRRKDIPLSPNAALLYDVLLKHRIKPAETDIDMQPCSG